MNLDTKHKALVQGKFFEKDSAKNFDANLRVAESEVFLIREVDDAVLAQAKLSEIDVTDRLGAVARRITFPDRSVFITHDNDAVDRVLGATISEKSVDWLEQFKPRLVLIFIVAVLAFAGLFRYGLPIAVSTAVAVTPDALVKHLSKTSFAGFERTLLSPTKIPEERRQKIQIVFRELVENSSERIRRFDPVLHFRGARIGPNAFAFPDGTIVVTDDLMQLVEDEALIGILGHELGHVHHQHSLRLIYRSAGFAVLIALVAGDVGGILEEVLFQGAGILTLSYNRRFEHQADAFSVDLMKRVGRDPKALLNFFQVIESKFPSKRENSSWFSTHPSSKERIEAIREKSAE